MAAFPSIFVVVIAVCHGSAVDASKCHTLTAEPPQLIMKDACPAFTAEFLSKYLETHPEERKAYIRGYVCLTFGDIMEPGS